MALTGRPRRRSRGDRGWRLGVPLAHAFGHEFTGRAAGGPETVFPDADVDALVDAIRAVGPNALPQDEVV